ncbi:S-adenosyl-L-methionine-dependent methyltransferase, partial [Podospora conica]
MTHDTTKEMAKSLRPPKPKKENPISAAIASWLTTLPPSLLDLILGPDTTPSSLLASSPKRWVVYEPMVLLPSGSFTSPPWAALLASPPTPDLLAPLWASILSNISQQSRSPLTHLAINDGIPLHLPSSSLDQEENLLRRPTNLLPLHGSFGPATFSSPSPTPLDFSSALWVSTTQNGLAQTWAPRWTMFSRGNVKEKARLLAFHSSPSQQPELPHRAATELQGKLAVDLYAGIGYFVFSYARLGLRVLCWEVNPWSVEGLRRGAERNKFSVRVVRPDEEDVDVAGGGEQIVVFLEDNARAKGRLEALGVGRGEVVHVNCGLLPSSEGSWRTAWEAVEGGGGWVHVHENVGVGDIERRRGEVEKVFKGWGGEARVEHVELVKTFAPGVWHCVFDVFITRG